MWKRFVVPRNVLAVFLALLVLAAGCGPGLVQPTATPTEVAGEITEEVRATRDAALAYISEHYPEQAPAPGLAWTEEYITPEGLLGWSTYEFTAQDWVVTIGHAVVPPQMRRYEVTVENPTTGFWWEGWIDPEGHVTEGPEMVLTALDAALQYISENYPDQAPALDLAWEGGRTTPEGLLGSETFQYTANDWMVTISYPVVALEEVIYSIVVENPTTGFRWEGQLDAEGNLTETVPPTAGQPLTLEALKNAAYLSEWPADGVAQLVDGEYEEEIVPGAASKLIIVFYRDMYAFGDLDGDGVEDAAVVLATSGGGSGTFISLEAVINDQGTPKHVATAFLGDRVQVNSVVIESGIITVDMVTHGPDDPLCCPTLEVTQRYELQGDTLVELSNEG